MQQHVLQHMCAAPMRHKRRRRSPVGRAARHECALRRRVAAASQARRRRVGCAFGPARATAGGGRWSGTARSTRPRRTLRTQTNTDSQTPKNKFSNRHIHTQSLDIYANTHTNLRTHTHTHTLTHTRAKTRHARAAAALEAPRRLIWSSIVCSVCVSACAHEAPFPLRLAHVGPFMPFAAQPSECVDARACVFVYVCVRGRVCDRVRMCACRC